MQLFGMQLTEFDCKA